MKSIQATLLRITLAILFAMVGTSYSLAYDHDDRGWYDSHHQRHAFIHHNGHRGYWDHDKGGAKIFINV